MRAAVLALLCAACPRPLVVAALDPAAIYAQAQAAQRNPETLSCNAKAIVEAPENGGHYPLHLLVQRPASLRIEALTPLGDPAAVLVADQGRFALLDLRNEVFYRGPATPQNLSRLIATPLTAAELVSLVTGSIPGLRDAVPQSANREGEGYRLVLAAPGIVQQVWLAADFRLQAVRRTSERGDPIWEATIAEPEEGAGMPLARAIHLEAPQAKTRVDLRMRNVVAGKPPPEGAFLLAVPKGMRAIEVE